MNKFVFKLAFVNNVHNHVQYKWVALNQKQYLQAEMGTILILNQNHDLILILNHLKFQLF